MAVAVWFLIACTLMLMMIAKMLPRFVAQGDKESLIESGVYGSLKTVAKPKRNGNMKNNNNNNNNNDNKSEEVDEGMKRDQRTKKKKRKRKMRGPWGLPLLGSLHLLGGEGGPFEAFTQMARKYGEIYGIQLGVAKCVVVSSYRLVKEVLITKGSHFGGRPDFLRFHQLFGGDRNNSLALCDWSELQRTRRALARSYCSPRGGSAQQEELCRVADLEARQMIQTLEGEEGALICSGEQPVKPLVLAALANMFTRYMCSTRFSYADREFRKTVRVFDEIFWEINQGYAVDFLPWLRPFYAGHMKQLNSWATEIRAFILRRIIDRHRASLDTVNGIPRDFTDALLLHLESPESGLSWEHVIFELEDFLGGHSAIGNLVMLVLANTVTHPEVQTKIQEECDSVLRQRPVITLDDRSEMPYTEAVIWETLRVSSSPIVPHVATRDTEIGGFPVSKDTVVFVNNYELNLGESYWGKESREFRPERFLRPAEASGCLELYKPAHFIPFSTGKRTCIGQRLVQGFAFATVASLVSKFRISAVPPIRDVDLAGQLLPGCVAVPPDTFHLVLTPRSSTGLANNPSQ